MPAARIGANVMLETTAVRFAVLGTNSARVNTVKLAKISDVRFRNPVYPGETITIEVKKKESLGGFTMMSGSIKSGDKRVLTVEFAVAWKVPGTTTP